MSVAVAKGKGSLCDSPPKGLVPLSLLFRGTKQSHATPLY